MPTLTDPAIAKIKPGDQIITLVDSHRNSYGLCFRCTPNGVRAWSYRYRFGRQQRRITFGNYPDLSLADARQKLRDAKKMLDDGKDPGAVKQERREADTFAELAESYITKHAKKRKRSWKEDQRILNADILPIFKNRLVRDITRRDIRELVEDVAERAPIMANRVVALLSKMFKFAIDQEVIDASPLVGFKRPTPEHARDRVLTDDEIRTFWTVADSFDPAMKAFWRLRLLTAQRSIEVSTMKWTEVDLAAGWWTIPATVAKNKLSHRVPLSDSALTILKELRTALDADLQARRDAGKDAKEPTYILDGARGKRQQSEAAAKFDIDNFRGHDLRRTAASKMTSAGISRQHVGHVLNHVEPGVTKVYDRHSYDGEKKIALDTWARTLTAIIEKKKDSKVVAFARS